uniref:CSON009409 protein n=1 Tax=Culicoides sonorensis TaxID=179676 RepID=A0A336MZX7_CULSO
METRNGSVSKTFLIPQGNLTFGGSASVPVFGPPTLGAGVTFDANKFGASLNTSHTIGVGTTTTAAGRVNVFDSRPHRIDASAFHTLNTPNHGPMSHTTGVGLGYTHVHGHGVSASVQHTSSLKQTDLGVKGNVNIYRDEKNSLDANAAINTSFGPSGPSKPSGSVVGLGYTHAHGHGVSASVKHTPSLNQTDLGVEGKVNIYRDEKNSLDAQAAINKSFGPSAPDKPTVSGGLVFTKKLD